MRKRATDTILTALLSVMIIVMGNGLGLTRCSHTGKTELIGLRTVSNCHKAGVNPMKGKCMSVRIIKLSPTTFSPAPTFDLQPACTTLPLAFAAPVTAFFAGDHQGVVTPESPPPSPPREYLTTLSTLII